VPIKQYQCYIKEVKYMARIVKQVSGKEKLTITGKIYQFGV
jgi:hypothetical protein